MESSKRCVKLISLIFIIRCLTKCFLFATSKRPVALRENNASDLASQSARFIGYKHEIKVEDPLQISK